MLILVMGLQILTLGTCGRVCADAVNAFSFENVATKAQALAAHPYAEGDGRVPDFLLNISYDQWRDIRFRTGRSLWRGENLPFEVQFFHPGFFYNRTVTINEISHGEVLPVPFSKEFWLEKPASGAHKIVVLALLDSPSVAGAYRFSIHPGKRTEMTIAVISNGGSDQHRAGTHGPIYAHVFIAGIQHQVGAQAQRSHAPFFQLARPSDRHNG